MCVSVCACICMYMCVCVCMCMCMCVCVHVRVFIFVSKTKQSTGFTNCKQSERFIQVVGRKYCWFFKNLEARNICKMEF